MSTYMEKKGNVVRKWYVVDAAGKPLGKTLCVEHTTPEEYARVMAPPPKTKESPER